MNLLEHCMDMRLRATPRPDTNLHVLTAPHYHFHRHHYHYSSHIGGGTVRGRKRGDKLVVSSMAYRIFGKTEDTVFLFFPSPSTGGTFLLNANFPKVSYSRSVKAM